MSRDIETILAIPSLCLKIGSAPDDALPTKRAHKNS